jgi:hypothetical protein
VVIDDEEPSAVANLRLLLETLAEGVRVAEGVGWGLARIEV